MINLSYKWNWYRIKYLKLRYKYHRPKTFLIMRHHKPKMILFSSLSDVVLCSLWSIAAAFACDAVYAEGQRETRRTEQGNQFEKIKLKAFLWKLYGAVCYKLINQILMSLNCCWIQWCYTSNMNLNELAGGPKMFWFPSVGKRNSWPNPA